MVIIISHFVFLIFMWLYWFWFHVLCFQLIPIVITFGRYISKYILANINALTNIYFLLYACLHCYCNRFSVIKLCNKIDTVKKHSDNFSFPSSCLQLPFPAQVMLLISFLLSSKYLHINAPYFAYFIFTSLLLL